MALRTEFETSGAWLFRYRSFLPLIALPAVIAAMLSFTYLGHSHSLDEVWDILSLLISSAGLVVRVITIGYASKGTSGRCTRQQTAETLNTSGMYSIVRHPLYLGNYVIVLGMTTFFHTWWMPVLATAVYALYYERIMFAEEAFLRQKFGGKFESWAAATPAIVPRLSSWTAPGSPFNWRKVLRREYTGFFGIIAAFCALEFAGDSIAEGHLQIDLPWVGLLVFGAAVYLTLRTLKKRTGLLHVHERPADL